MALPLEMRPTYVVVRHGDDHVVASRVRHDGRVVRDSFDYQRSHQAARAVEDRFGLSRPPERGGQLAQGTRSERESAQRRQVAPERDRLRQASKMRATDATAAVRTSSVIAPKPEEVII
jgi:hypothetical protein